MELRDENQDQGNWWDKLTTTPLNWLEFRNATRFAQPKRSRHPVPSSAMPVPVAYRRRHSVKMLKNLTTNFASATPQQENKVQRMKKRRLPYAQEALVLVSHDHIDVSP
jgi:hypothetical protein